MSDFSADARLFQRACRAIGAATKRAEADILNKMAKDVTLHAIRETPRVTGAKIRQELAGGRAERIIASRAKAAGKTITKKELRAGAKRMISARVRSASYIRAGWFKAAQQLGGRGGRVYSRGRAALGGAQKARPGKLVAVIENFSRGAELVGTEAVRRAIRKVATREIEWANRKVAKAIQKATER